MDVDREGQAPALSEIEQWLAFDGFNLFDTAVDDVPDVGRLAAGRLIEPHYGCDQPDYPTSLDR